MPRTPSPVTRYLHRGSSLPQLQRRLAQQERLLQSVRQLLPEPLREHCLGVIPRDGQVTLLTDSPVWASRLRFLGDRLLQPLRQQGLRCQRAKIRIVIQDQTSSGRKRRRQPRRLSRENAELLRLTAEQIGDKGLREALIRLSRHAGG